MLAIGAVICFAVDAVLTLAHASVGTLVPFLLYLGLALLALHLVVPIAVRRP